jgi:hypothetical protein
MTTQQIQEALAAPFDASEVKHKPAMVKGTRALALHYVDARCIMERLDAVVGVAGWHDAYEFLPDGSCLCRLSVLIGDNWITKMDVGGESEQKDEGDRHKAAVSDALKRAAVKFGVGRYLYRMPNQWVDYDPATKTLRMPTNCPPATNGNLRRQLLGLVESTGTALPALLRHYGAASVEKLSDEQCRDAIRRLQAKAPA